MPIYFTDGSFAIHWQNASAWYDSEGNMMDCQKNYWKNSTKHSRNIPLRHKHVREYLAKQGKQWTSTSIHAKKLKELQND